ncbi:hypothetical protein Tco_0422527 [Tanacetum coccineum]
MVFLFTSTPIDFSSYILNGLKIEILTLEILLGPAFRLLKGTRSNYVELEYDFEECYKALLEKLDWENPEGGDYPFDLSKPLPLITRGRRIEDMVLNIWSPVKVGYDLHALWGISHWREQHKTFYAYARGKQSKGDVYSTKCIMAVAHVKVMRKHGYGYLEEIIVRRADNALYKFKEGDFLRLRINDIEDTLLLVVQNWLTNLSGDDVADFAIISEKGTRTLHTKFSEDITKNIDMTYLPKRRWSKLEKKRAHYMIKDINKLLKERRIMRSLEKFVGGRLYGTDLRLLQRTI